MAIKALRLDVPPEQAAEVAEALFALAATWPVHEGLAAVVAAGLEGATPWLAMRHLEAPTLDTWLREGREAQLADTLSGLLSLAEAIDAAHSRQIVHGSLHPRDVFVGAGGSTTVTGFGIAQILTRVGVRPPVRRPYSAPEILSGARVAPPADLFALGALAFEWLTGRRPSGLGAEAAAHFDLGETPDAVAHARTILAAMLAEYPGHRPGSAMAFAQALSHAIDPAFATRTPVFLSTAEADSSPDVPTAPVSGAATGPGAAGAGDGPESAEPAHGDPPSEDALRLFAMQGTLWEAPRAAEDWDQDEDAATAGSPLARDVAGGEGSPIVYPAPGETLLERTDTIRSRDDQTIVASSRDDAIDEGSVLGLRSAAPMSNDSILPEAHVAGRAAVAAPDPVPESSAPPAVVLVLTLALGLAVGGAGGFLLGQRSAARPHEPPPVATPAQPPEEASPAAGNATPPPTASPAAPAPPVVDDAVPGRGRALASTGELIVRSKPDQAGVVVNNVWRGRTPLTLRGLSLGMHTVRVVQRGFAAETRRVLLDARVPAATVSVQLARAEPASTPVASAPTPGATTGSLFIESRPSAAHVHIDDHLVGSTPLLISQLTPGAHSVRLEHPGHRSWTTTVSIAAGQRQRVAASLEEGSPE